MVEMKDVMETGIEAVIGIEAEDCSKVNAGGPGTCRKGGDNDNRDSVANPDTLDQKRHVFSVYVARSFPSETDGDIHMSERRVFFRRT